MFPPAATSVSSSILMVMDSTGHGNVNTMVVSSPIKGVGTSQNLTLEDREKISRGWRPTIAYDANPSFKTKVIYLSIDNISCAQY